MIVRLPDLQPQSHRETDLDRQLFLHWLEQLYATKENEIDCDRLQALLPAHVDFEINGENLPDKQLALVRAHLAQCPDCNEDYQALRAVALLEVDGDLPEAHGTLNQFEAEESYAGD